MATFGQIAHAIQDFSKTISDDAVINIDHIIFLMSKYRNYLLSNPTKNVTNADYQTICIDLVPYDEGNICSGEPYLISEKPVPNIMSKGEVTVSPMGGFMYSSKFQFVNYEKFTYAGLNKWFNNFIYVTIGPDGHLFVKSKKAGFIHINKMKVTALFDDIEKAAELSCEDCSGNNELHACDIEDKEFPLDAAYIPLLMKYVTQEITAAAWNPRDDSNNASDDISVFARVLQNYTNNAFKRKTQGGKNEEEEQ